MSKKIQEGWQLVVVGHSLGAGAASLISLKLHHYYPQLRCLAFSCPGGLVSKKLSHAMKGFVTTVAVGKDCIPRASVATITRLMDELVTALARCKQPKIKVLFFPWLRRHSQRFRDLFYNYDEIPEESVANLLKYYESRRRLGQPIEMYPPGKIIFLRPIKSGRGGRRWDAVFIAPEDLMNEGILVSPNMLKDHLCSTAYDALKEAKEKAEAVEERREVRGGENIIQGVWRGAGRAVRAPWNVVQGATQAWGGYPARARQGSLQQGLINAV
jgi:sn1-specific diacylglycerol lipase